MNELLTSIFSTQSIESLQHTTNSIRRNQANQQKKIQDLGSSLSEVFSNDLEDQEISKMKRYLGGSSRGLSNEQIKNMVSEFHFLIDVWLDEFEKEIFDGKTLREVIGSK